MEFQELFNKVDTFNNDHSLTSVIKSNTVPEFNKKIIEAINTRWINLTGKCSI